MKAKTTFLLVLTLLIVSSVSILSGFAQHRAYTQLSLPAGAKARLGKGSTRLGKGSIERGNVFSRRFIACGRK